jgi:hypothetical protein
VKGVGRPLKEDNGKELASKEVVRYKNDRSPYMRVMKR